MEHKNIPEIRFSGFTNEWEQRKLGELASFSKGNGYTKNDLVEFGDPIILYGRLYTKYETVIEKVDTFVNKKDKSIISEGSEVIVPASGESSEDISRASVVGKSGIILGGDLNIIKPVNYIDSIFLALTISNGSQQKEMSKRAQGKSVVHLHNSDLKQVNILYPKLEEQQKIGSFFKQLDNTIALHQRKLDLLKEQKKGFLQKMFPKNSETVPELRFSGFTNEWEQRKLGEITKRVTRKNKELESTLPLTISAQYGLVDQITYFDKRIASKDVSNYYLIKKGEFAYNKSYSKDFPWGAVKRLDNYDKGVLSTLYIVFKPTDIESNFLVSYYDTTMWHKEVSIRAAEGARNHGLLNITAKDFFDTDLIISTNSKEQQKIGSFFKQLDDTIALHQRKLELLKEQKKGFLQKMFPKNS
ncbi:restriction endonuclease subunit S [Brochothrix thermosphacta]|uniref:restriction endonuclease subunit S n=1 Tax=Brochothrix thermosphacta TaxID=2756 RepID=UPI002713583D|nr:restriction endonuclease subunit S [Brochothrix thermosphacta]MDO7864454.1 restriction endonuclease subunit S [Brochothrix thermosphacta]